MDQIYCLDANVLIEAWQKYYSPIICPDYWDILNELGKKERVFIPEEVRSEIVNSDPNSSDDELSVWVKNCSIPIHKLDEKVIACWRKILQADPSHQRLVDSVRYRSIADPWVISHAMNMNAVVVTKENLELNSKTKIKIPNVCENMGVKWMNDFEFVRELGITFSCKLS